jgi:flavodoxin
MRKVFNIIVIIVVVLVIAFFSSIAVAGLDVAAYMAAGFKTLTPSGASVGKALVVYDPGLSGAAKGFAGKVASDLQGKGYTVTLAGVKSSAASHTSNFSVIVVGGPIYGGRPTVSVRDFLSKLSMASGARLGLFGTGWFPQANEVRIRNAVTVPSNTVIVKVNRGEDVNAKASDFVNQLLS